LAKLLGHIDCPSNFDDFVYVVQLVPTTEYQTTSLDIPDSRLMVYEREEEVEGKEKQLLLALEKMLLQPVGIEHSNQCK
jgi:hypothetical protein